jgi:thymidine kinase
MSDNLKLSTGISTPQLAGYLEIFLGSMFSGKTLRLIMAATQKADTGCKVAYINHSGDIRSTIGGDTKSFTSHSSTLKSLSPEITALSTKNLKDVDVTSFDVIAVDEGNFYPDIVETVTEWVSKFNKCVYIAALDGSFSMGLFGNVYQLLPKADKFKKLSGECLLCRDEHRKAGYTGPLPSVPAPFSMRLTHSDQLELVGGADKYIATCRAHHQVPTVEK